ncbi:MAG: S41 family peptidase, partial [Wenzhouxiangella sp.]|nr:S41 family peptidase [Wenzhouxiangella sp.]
QYVVESSWRFLRDHTIVGLMFLLLSPLPAEAIGDDTALETGAAAIRLETFDQVWNQVRDQYFDYRRIEAEWLAAREELRPQAATATTAELRRLLNDMLERVGESHFTVLPPTGVNGPTDGDDPESITAGVATELNVRLIDGALIIIAVGQANAGQIEPGWELTAIGDRSLTSLIAETLSIEDPAARMRAQLVLEASVVDRIGFPSRDEALVLTLLDDTGAERQVTARTRNEAMRIVRIGNLPSLPFAYRAEQLGSGENCVGYLGFTTWVPELMDRFDESRDALFACQGLVIDLRGNLGGVLTTMMPLASHLFPEMVLLGQLIRDDGRIDFRAFPRRVDADGRRLTPYSGPVSILIDSLSASTSEMFTSGMQALGRARVFGTPSPGMALPAQMLPLANGDRLMFAFADYSDGEGRRIEGIGVRPDEIVEPDREAISSGEDAVLEAALAWLVSNQPSLSQPES